MIEEKMLTNIYGKLIKKISDRFLIQKMNDDLK